MSAGARYLGRPCLRHPELKGERYKCNWTCVACQRVRVSTHLKAKQARGGLTASHRARQRLTGIGEQRYRPKWASWKEIIAVYQQAVDEGKEVDHYYPLQGEAVCGLHCPANFVITDRQSNAIKGSRMP